MIWTQEAMLAEAGFYEDQWVSSPAEGPATRFHWRFVPDYPISRWSFKQRSDAKEFMLSEIQTWTDDGQPDRFDDLFVGAIRDPIVLVEVKKKPFIWDGNHRFAASVLMNRLTIPALVGRL